MKVFLTTPRLQLRALVAADTEAVYRYRSHADVCRFQSFAPQTRDEVSSFIERVSGSTFGTSEGWHQAGIEERRSGCLIGDCGVHILDPYARQAEVGITISPNYQRRGFAVETLHAVFEHLFTTLGLHRVTASVDPRNVSSMSLMQRLGLRLEGRLIQSLWFKGEWADDALFAILESEWRERRARS